MRALFVRKNESSATYEQYEKLLVDVLACQRGVLVSRDVIIRI